MFYDGWWAILGAFAIAAIVGGWSAARRKNQFEASLRSMWAFFDGPITYERPRADDAELIKRLDAVDTTTIERHFVRLGDLMIESDETRTPLRVFSDSSQETVVYVVVTGHVSVGLESYADEDELVTLKDPVIQRCLVTYPPFSHHAFVPSSSTIEETIAKHRELIASVAKTPLVRIGGLDEASQQFIRFATRTRRWRSSQDPDSLLESDVRAALGDALYERIGAAWVTRLKKKRAKLPEARLKERRQPPA